MKINVIFLSIASMALANCSLDDRQEDHKQEVPASTSHTNETTATPSYAIIRAPLDANGEPDLSKAELQTQADSATAALDDAAIAEAFAKIGTSTQSKSLASFEELDATSSTESWYILPWRARVAAGLPVRSGPYLLPWRRAIANGYPVRTGGYLLPFRRFVANSQGYYVYNCNQPCLYGAGACDYPFPGQFPNGPGGPTPLPYYPGQFPNGPEPRQTPYY
jgi:hypothetical protein